MSVLDILFEHKISVLPFSGRNSSIFFIFKAVSLTTTELRFFNLCNCNLPMNAFEILGYFYEDELSLVINPEDIEYKIEKILEYKTIKGKKYALVKYKSYDDKFNEWIPVSAINKLK